MYRPRIKRLQQLSLLNKKHSSVSLYHPEATMFQVVSGRLKEHLSRVFRFRAELKVSCLIGWSSIQVNFILGNVFLSEFKKYYNKQIYFAKVVKHLVASKHQHFTYLRESTRCFQTKLKKLSSWSTRYFLPLCFWNVLVFLIKIFRSLCRLRLIKNGRGQNGGSFWLNKCI